MMIEKNRKKEQAKRQRVYFDMNTGTRIHKDSKHPSRQDRKKDLRKILNLL